MIFVLRRVVDLEAEVLVERDRAFDIDDPDERDELADALLRLLHPAGQASDATDRVRQAHVVAIA